MDRSEYKLFQEGRIGTMKLKNRLVRSGTYEPGIWMSKKMSGEVLGRYRALADGGAGLIISTVLHMSHNDWMNIDGIEQLPELIHSIDRRCKIAAQVLFWGKEVDGFSTSEAESIVECIVDDIVSVKEFGFDAAQIHAAHSFGINQMISPTTNHRKDKYGGSLEKRCRFIKEIVDFAREEVGDYPIFIKLPAYDRVEGGINIETFPALAEEIQNCGIDAIEISTGYPPDMQVMLPELRGINRIEKESYFFPYAQAIDVDIPVMIVGGNRHVDRCEQLLQTGKVDFISMCRPFICEPDLPNRWLEGSGKETADCIFCNSCYKSCEELGIPNQCIFKRDKELYRKIQEKLKRN